MLNQVIDEVPIHIAVDEMLHGVLIDGEPIRTIERAR